MSKLPRKAGVFASFVLLAFVALGILSWLRSAPVREDMRLAHGTSHWLCFAIAPDNRTVALGDEAGEIRTWDIDTGRLSTVFCKVGAPVKALAFSGDGRWLASGTANGSMCIWMFPSGEMASSLKVGGEPGLFTFLGHSNRL